LGVEVEQVAQISTTKQTAANTSLDESSGERNESFEGCKQALVCVSRVFVSAYLLD
jgi:hypothetical protein